MTTIAEVAAVCERRCADDLGWFAELGRWATDETDPRRQRLFAEAAHRHAWHAELWAGRRPRIPPEVAVGLPVPSTVGVPADRVTGYADAIEHIRSDLAELADATDPELDPSTHRVIALVDADLADLLRRLA